MKRFGLLILMFFTGFILVGCDMIPTDIVEQTTEEICRENPDNEICDIQSLSDVEETAAEALVLEAITIMNDENMDTCDTVFSKTNTELLDACKNNELLTENVESFTILDYEKEGSTYIFKGEAFADTFLQISIKIGSIDGEMRITSFDVVSIEDPRDETLSLETFEVLMKEYFKDYLDSQVTTAQLAESYFGVELGTRFMLQRERDISSLGSLEYISATMLEDNYFEVTYTINTEEETMRVVRDIRTEQVNNKPRMFDVSDEDCDDDGVVACPADEMLNEEEVTTFLETYYADYLDPAIPDQDFADMYMGGEFEDDWSETRSMAIRNETTITVKAIHLNDNNEFAAEIEYQDGDDLVLRKRPGRAKYGDITLKKGYVVHSYIDSSLVLDQDVATKLIEEFIRDFQDLDITNEELIRSYFGGDLDGDGLEDLVMTRESEITNGLTLEVDTNVPYQTFGLFPVNLTLTNNEQQETKALTFVIKELDKATPYIYKIGDDEILDCDDDDDGLPTCTIDESLDQDEVTDFIESYYQDYIDPDISNDMFHSKYTGTTFEDDWQETRQRHITNNTKVTVKNIYFNDDNEFAVEVEYQDGDDLVLRKRPGRAKYGDITLKKAYALSGYMESSIVIDETYANDYIKQFFMDYQNVEITDETFFRTYFNDDSYYALIGNRQEDLRNGLTIDINTDTPYLTFGVFTVQFTLMQGDITSERELQFMIKEIDKATPYLYPVMPSEDNDCDIIEDSCETLTDSAQVLQTMQKFITMYNDKTIKEEVLKEYVIGEIILMEDRDMYLDTDMNVTLSDTIRPLEDNFFLVQIEIDHPDTIIHRDIAVRIYMSGSSYYIREDVPFDASFFSLQ